MKKCSLTCPVCSHTFHSRVKRNWFLRNVLYFLPIKIYFCNVCEKNVYILVKDQTELLNKPTW